MDSAFILCFLLLGIRLTQALTPDEYISLRRHNHTSQRDAIRPSPVQIFMHSPKNLKTKILNQPDLINRRSEKFQTPSSPEYYSPYDQYDGIPAVPKKHQAPTKPAFAFAKYDDYYPVRKPSSKTKPQYTSPEAKNPKRPTQVFTETPERTPRKQGRSSGEGLYPQKNMQNKLINAEESTTHRHIHDDKRKEYRGRQIPGNKRQNQREERKSMSGSEVREQMSQTEDDKMFVAATGYGGNTRGQFHEQGMEGPHSYKFGYNTGDSYNPMARYEEKDADGIVRGSYSYVDARGELQVVHYESHPKFGFKTKSGHGSYSY